MTLRHWPGGRSGWPAQFATHARRAPAGPLASFYQRGIPSADCPLAEAPMTAIDIETTGLDPSRDSIVSIGLITLDLTRIQCRGAHHWIYQPQQALSGESVAIHAITHSEVSASPPLAEHFGDLLEALAGRVAVAHYAAIERRFLAAAARRIYGYPLLFPIIDTMELERRHYRQGLRGLLSPAGSLRLDACRQRLGLPRYKAHHALTDALAAAELLQAQVAHRYPAKVPLSRLWR